MSISLDQADRDQAISSICRYFQENFPDGMPVDEAGRARLGQLGAGALLGFLLQEIGPLIYNQAVADVQERLVARVQEVDIEVHQPPFTYWQSVDRAGGKAGGKRRDRSR
jgi:uncharacterized protein (DUF2164 family)